ncbi:hypothetical protein T484DRAFT_2573695 [Baffinella frigidus]|nr:hypothetical protein T484DRAFT_2573695 [Cryptophyta sp. CCMP2293]
MPRKATASTGKKGKLAAPEPPVMPRKAAAASKGKKAQLAPPARLPSGLIRHDLDELSADDALALYKRDQLLWLRLPQAQGKRCAAFGMSSLQTLHKQCPSLFQTHWSIENPGEHEKEKLTPNAVFGPKGPPAGQYYVSSILQKDDAALKKFFAKVPFAEAPLLKKAKATHDDGVWLFVGSNPAAKTPSAGAKPAGKRKREEPPSAALRGRPEHTDAVDHSGTWHVQLQGNKTWFVRPCADAHDWGSSPPVLEEGTPGVVQEARGGLRLRVDCEEGDLLLVNTRAWWHRTDIPPQEAPGFSMSYARDFYLEGSISGASGGSKGSKGSKDGGGKP